jgi:hypothetical protein
MERRTKEQRRQELKAVFDYLATMGGAYTTDVSREFGITDSRALRHLRALDRAGLIRPTEGVENGREGCGRFAALAWAIRFGCGDEAGEEKFDKAFPLSTEPAEKIVRALWKTTQLTRDELDRLNFIQADAPADARDGDEELEDRGLIREYDRGMDYSHESRTYVLTEAGHEARRIGNDYVERLERERVRRVTELANGRPEEFLKIRLTEKERDRLIDAFAEGPLVYDAFLDNALMDRGWLRFYPVIGSAPMTAVEPAVDSSCLYDVDGSVRIELRPLEDLEEQRKPIYTDERLPFATRENARRYVERGEIPGGFVRHVLENHLVEAFRYGDAGNVAALSIWVEWLISKCPADACGSPEAVDAWIAHRGLAGLNK